MDKSLRAVTAKRAKKIQVLTRLTLKCQSGDQHSHKSSSAFLFIFGNKILQLNYWSTQSFIYDVLIQKQCLCVSMFNITNSIQPCRFCVNELYIVPVLRFYKTVFTFKIDYSYQVSYNSIDRCFDVKAINPYKPQYTDRHLCSHQLQRNEYFITY